MIQWEKMDSLLISDDVLDKLGFSEYWDEHGTWGGRTLTFSDGQKFRIVEQEQMDDDSEGYSAEGKYISNHYYFCDWYAIPKLEKPLHYELYFLHEVYICIREFYPNCLNEFVEKCKDNKMYYYIQSYLNDEIKS